MQETDDHLDEETFVPLKEKRQLQNRKVGMLVLSLIIIGTALFFSVVMIMRSGGMPRILFVLLSLALGYLVYEAIIKFKSVK
ncbi:MAG: hypothetical protein QMB45_07490 [Flavobacteriales bacterium]|jgi:uncharacterized YccA/Bax inhibitor family protein|tara:strand:- start:976 stop:1221 length:246 start_codon:yes stop_codon:yes gene_type:complete